MPDVYDLKSLPQRAARAKKPNRKLVRRLKKINPRKLDAIIHRLHDESFEHIDCLKCGNCCRSISPIIIDKDIDRISKHLQIKPSEFAEKYLEQDDAGVYGFNQTPCPFLGDDNYCAIYKLRPRACAEYPHTDRSRVYQALDLSIKNTGICPAVYEIFEKLKEMNY